MQTLRLDEGLYRTDADNGVIVLSESLPAVRSVAVAMWVRTASAHEDRSRMGVSHLLEHMVFKGTERRSARDIALELEARIGIESGEGGVHRRNVLELVVGDAHDDECVVG